MPVNIERLEIENAEMAFELARTRGWSRIDVTAPESEGWERTRAFYEREGFTFTGPKLKLGLK